MRCCMISINPTLNYLGGHLTSYLKSATLITLVFMCILPQMSSEAMATSKRPQRSFDLRFEISNLDYPGIHVPVASNCHIDDLQGHDSLQPASEVTNDLRIELSDLNYLHSHASRAAKCHHKSNRKDTNLHPLISGSATRTTDKKF